MVRVAVVFWTVVQLLLSAVVAEPIPLEARQGGAPKVDLGYSIYQGSYDANAKINTFKGIRYAAPPLGALRWQPPKDPPTNRSSVISATAEPPVCPQTGPGIDTPPEYGFNSRPGDEDCLFLNVFAPANANNLPVFFWIHGGGYNVFSMRGVDGTPMISNNGNKFIVVAIQYRMGAFGFLAGEDVKRKGALNAGLLDMNFALQWVQKYIRKFGGDPSRVTIGGESAGAMAAIYQAMAYGGSGKSLFNNIISQSPWIAAQYNYNDAISTKAYNDFVAAAGCNNAGDKIKCLQQADTVVLQNASAKVSEAKKDFGIWAFLPVTDGTFVKTRPSIALLSKSIQGKRILTGNNANEGVPLSPPTAFTVDDFKKYIRTTFPSFTDRETADLLTQYSYPGDTLPTDPNAPKYETSGTSGPTANQQSGFGTGQQQRVFNVFAEYAFDCPSYWQASAFPQAWKYQFSFPPSYHGADLPAYWSTQNPKAPGKAVKHAVQKIWGNFIVNNSPIISVSDAKGNMTNSTVPEGRGGLIEWPMWNEARPTMLSLNTTGGVPSTNVVNKWLSITSYLEPGVTNKWALVDARRWEGGRGERCAWWKRMAARVPY